MARIPEKGFRDFATSPSFSPVLEKASPQPSASTATRFASGDLASRTEAQRHPSSTPSKHPPQAPHENAAAYIPRRRFCLPRNNVASSAANHTKTHRSALDTCANSPQHWGFFPSGRKCTGQTSSLISLVIVGWAGRGSSAAQAGVSGSEEGEKRQKSVKNAVESSISRPLQAPENVSVQSPL